MGTGTGEAGCGPLIAIGASTGGPKALLQLLRGLGPAPQARLLIVQHIAKNFAAGLAAWLDRESPFAVRLARSGDRPQPGLALLAPPDRHMELQGGRILLSDGPPRHACRPAVDVLFESLAHGAAPRVIAVLLTGMGRDGAAGLLALHQAGAQTIVQDEASSLIFGMPKAAIALGAARQTLALDQIPAAVLRLLTPTPATPTTPEREPTPP
jgi:two-component system, chemotaxis family, protein-glutamate methylesterase/glutaminase